MSDANSSLYKTIRRGVRRGLVYLFAPSHSTWKVRRFILGCLQRCLTAAQMRSIMCGEEVDWEPMEVTWGDGKMDFIRRTPESDNNSLISVHKR